MFIFEFLNVTPEIVCFLQAYKNTYYTQYIKKLDFVRHFLLSNFYMAEYSTLYSLYNF